jgi:hypothetical protein
MTIANAPVGFSTINPFIITRDADGLIRFLTEVFDGVDHPDARTIDDDGLLLHAELQIGETTIMFGERKPGWPFTPALLQIYVDDVDTTLERPQRAVLRSSPGPLSSSVTSSLASSTRGTTCGGSTARSWHRRPPATTPPNPTGPMTPQAPKPGSRHLS